MIGGLPYTRYFVIGFLIHNGVASDDEHIKLELPKGITLEKIKEIIGPDAYGDDDWLVGACYPIDRRQLSAMGFDVATLPDAEYTFDAESDGFYSQLNKS